jgi:hypothetical protein
MTLCLWLRCARLSGRLLAAFTYCAISLALFAAQNARAQQTTPPVQDDSFIDRYQARVTATQNEQPHWVTPLVTVTPRLEQELRTDFVHQYNPHGFAIWNYDNSKGLEFIPERHIEILINMPPWFNRSNGEPDGWGDISFNSKFRILARNEEHGNAIVTAFFAASVPTGENGNGAAARSLLRRWRWARASAGSIWFRQPAALCP